LDPGTGRVSRYNPAVLFLRALAAFLILPGTMGFAIPLLLIEPEWRSRPFEPLAAVPLVAGLTLLLACVREFYVAGKGTLAPWSPPVHLVTTGPYRYSRNPMYVAMALVLIGWAWGFRSWPLAGWAVFMVAAFHTRILLGEEPRLAREFGAAWNTYRATVPRWLGTRGTRAGTRGTPGTQGT
jgi:protein-S-isoprenylcysteine O-methyltransferase Ste14